MDHEPELKLVKSKHGTVVGFISKVPFASPWRFSLEPEMYLPKFFKQLRLLRELQIGDLVWDEAVFIVGDEPAVVNLIQSYPQLKESFFWLIGQRYKIKVNGYKIEVWGEATEANLTEKMAQLNPHLENICTTLASSSMRPTNRNQDWMFYTFIWGLIFLSAVTLYHINAAIDSNVYPLKHDLAVYGLGVGLVAAFIPALCWRLIRRLHSRSHWEFTGLFVVSLITCILGAGVGLFEINQKWDNSMWLNVRCSFVTKNSYSHKGRMHYNAVFECPLPKIFKLHFQTKKIQKSLTLEGFEYYSSKSQLEATVHPGYFSQPWLRIEKMNP